MAKIAIDVITTQAGGEVIPQATQSVQDLGRAGETAGGGIDQLGTAVTGFIAGLSLEKVIQFGVELEQLGVKSERAVGGLNALSNGQAAQYMDAMTASTRGLVDNMSLAADATHMLSSGVVSSASEAAKLAGIGATLGAVFQDSAATGIETMTRVAEMPGMTRPLKELGINIGAVKTEFEDLKKSGMDAESAWLKSIEDVGGKTADQLQGVVDSTSAMDRLNARLENFKQYEGTRIAIGVEATIDFVDAAGHAIAADIIKSKGEERPTGLLGDLTNFLLGPRGSVVPGLQATQFGVGGGGTGSNGGLSDADILAMQGSASGERAASHQADAALDPAYYASQLEAQNQMRLRRGSQGSGMAGLDTGGLYNQMGGDALQGIANGIQTAFVNAQLGASTLKAGIESAIPSAEKFMDTFKQKTSLDEAFGINRANVNQIDTQLGGGMQGPDSLSGGINAARQALQQADRGKSAAQQAADLQVFDTQAKRAQDDFALSTGQATKESLAFRDATESVSEKMAKGTISLGEGERQMLALATAAKEGKTSMLDLLTATTAPAAHPDSVFNMGAEEHIPGYVSPSGGKGGTPTAPAAKADPLKPFTDSADVAKTHVMDLNSNISYIPGVMDTAANGAARGLRPMNQGILETGTLLDRLKTKISNLNQTVTITVSTSGGLTNTGH